MAATWSPKLSRGWRRTGKKAPAVKVGTVTRGGYKNVKTWWRYFFVMKCENHMTNVFC
jgi:hypothetical protein